MVPWHSQGDLLLAFLLSREEDGLWRPQSDLSPILTATDLTHEVDEPWRPQGDLLLAYLLSSEVDGPWCPQK
jgi:hypothetical protein